MPSMRLVATWSALILAVVAVSYFSISAWAAENSPGQTRIANWKDDKKAAFMLMFDDSLPSHVKNVIPELKGRGLTATFYVNPGKGEWKLYKEKWEKEIPALGMEYGNHTFTHKGVKDMADADEEFGKAKDVILGIHPERKNPRLISFGIPGVAKGAWNITDAQRDELLRKHHLILRPHIDGRFAVIHLKTADEMLKVVEKALAAGGRECVIFHGVGGEWISTPMPTFVAFINGLMEKRDQLWISDHISVHKYETERSSASVKVLESTEKQIRLRLSSKADPDFYDAPLTLVTKVPAGWQNVRIGTSIVKAAHGAVQYDALPGSEIITLRPE